MKIGIFGTFDEGFGYGRGTIALARALRAVGVEPVLYPHGDTNWAEFRNCGVQADVWIAHCTPPQLDWCPSGPTILYTMWESEHLPTGYNSYGGDWPQQIQQRNPLEVWCPTRFPADVFARAGFRSRVVPYGLQLEGIEPKVDKPYDTFTVLVAGELVHRKGVSDAIQAFQLAFPGDRNTQLVLKTYGDTTNLRVPYDKQIVVFDEHWPREKLIEAYRQANCFLWLSHGEGFSLPPIEALAAGTPVICAYNTGMRDWLDLVKWKVKTVNTGDIYRTADYLHTIRLHNRSFADYAVQASEILKAHYTLEKSGHAILNALKELF